MENLEWRGSWPSSENTQLSASLLAVYAESTLSYLVRDSHDI